MVNVAWDALVAGLDAMEAAARRLYCHRHTLRYRIRKIEELTGRDLSSARDRIEELEDALGGGHGGLQDVVFLAEILDRPQEALGVLYKGRQHADGHPAAGDRQQEGRSQRKEQDELGGNGARFRAL